MTTRLITFCYRKVIDVNSTGRWERMVFEDTYTEFLMQLQNYDRTQQYATYSQLLQHVPEAGKLNYLVSSACIGYLQQLNEKLPDITDSLGKLALSFKSFQFEIINSDIRNRDIHQVAINFFSEAMIWHDTIGNAVLVSKPTEELSMQDFMASLLIPMVPYLAIHSIKTIA